MSECLLYYIKEGTTKIGRSNATNPPDIVLFGTHILDTHCLIQNTSNLLVQLTPCPGALCYVNGIKLDSAVSLKSSDRVIFGNSHVFRFNHPEQARKDLKVNSNNVDWVSATQELKDNQGIDIKHEMDRLLALDEQYKKEVETNKIYKEQIIEYTSKINDLEKKVDIMTKSMMSSSCIASLSNMNGSYDAESTSVSIATLGDDEMAHSVSCFMTDREYRIALWVAKRWRYHQMTSLRVSSN